MRDSQTQVGSIRRHHIFNPRQEEPEETHLTSLCSSLHILFHSSFPCTYNKHSAYFSIIYFFEFITKLQIRGRETWERAFHADETV